MVAPLAGAWIEIKKWTLMYNKRVVAPLAGAWIEIFDKKLKKQRFTVAPLAGAWIEIQSIYWMGWTGGWSLPSRERGLKLLKSSGCKFPILSLPSRERGLKLISIL